MRRAPCPGNGVAISAARLMQQRRVQLGQHGGDLGGGIFSSRARTLPLVLNGCIDDIGLSLRGGPHRTQIAKRNAEPVSAQCQGHRAQGARIETATSVRGNDTDGDQLLELGHGGAGMARERGGIQGRPCHSAPVGRYHTRDR